MAKTVKDLMTSNVEVVAPNDTVYAAAQLMKRIDVGSVPVVESGTIKGILTDRDIVVRVVAAGQDAAQTSVKDAMSTGVVYAAPDWSLKQAAQAMADAQVRRLPVVEHDRLVGIVALGDIAVDGDKDRLSGTTLEEISEPAQPDR